ncbi:MAG: hypothetical protein SOZ90_06395 [Candidatus Faecousia sp.]|nr:hypothetical protein [Candidatus Faecousia sp.]
MDTAKREKERKGKQKTLEILGVLGLAEKEGFGTLRSECRRAGIRQVSTGHLHLDGSNPSFLIRQRKEPLTLWGERFFSLATVDNNDTVSKGFIWFQSKNETIKREVKLSFRTETMLISLSNWNLSTYPGKNSKNHYHSSNSDKYTTYYRFC